MTDIHPALLSALEQIRAQHCLSECSALDVVHSHDDVAPLPPVLAVVQPPERLSSPDFIRDPEDLSAFFK